MSARVVGNYLVGRRVEADAAAVQAVFNPATGKVIAEVALSGAAEVDQAVAAAAAAQPAWGAVLPSKRAKVFVALQALLTAHSDRLARVVSAEHGKTIPDAAGEIARGLEIIDYCMALPELLKGEYSRAVGNGIDTYSMRMPLGVVAGVTPFNFPVMVPLWMLAPAIACGNAFVLKPSERDPSAALVLAELLAEAGLPDGIFSVVQGAKAAVGALLAHPQVKALSFVGSTAVARQVYAEGCRFGKRIQALGGAKNHMVIMPDADVTQVTDALMGSVYGSAGERCMAVSVAVPVGAKIADALIEELTPRVRDLKIGPGDEEGVEMGPLITQAQRERVASYIAKGVEDKAELIVDGRDWQPSASCAEGFFIGGTLFDKVEAGMSIYTDEIFGPVLSTVRVQSAAAALDLVNSHQYGNGTAIFSRDGMAGHEFAEAVEAGMVGINVPIPVPVGYHSFGGWKNSLFGANAIYGPEGIRFYSRLKTVTTRWLGAARLGPEFSFRKSDS